MEIFKKASQVQLWSRNMKKNAKTVCLVPTMGCFHQGHLSLIKTGSELFDNVVVSIFVNPAQFGENEDLDSYPSDIERDLAKASKLNVDAVFLPEKDELYPKNFQTHVALEKLPNHLCGLSRPVHFKGVATIVAKLFNIADPDGAVFGQKDFQQLMVIRQMTKDLNFNIKIIGAPIVRESDGLAMSSRNAYLEPGQRKSALSLSKSIEKVKNMVKKGEAASSVILRTVIDYIESFEGTRIAYAALCDPETLEKTDEIKEEVLFALAVQIGKTRLIDNALITPDIS